MTRDKYILKHDGVEGVVYEYGQAHDIFEQNNLTGTITHVWKREGLKSDSGKVLIKPKLKQKIIAHYLEGKEI